MQRYSDKLNLVIERLDVEQYSASIMISHKTYRDLLDFAFNKIKYADYC